MLYQNIIPIISRTTSISIANIIDFIDIIVDCNYIIYNQN